jgi:tetratricopeptide (TPR) repeat protein/DNA-binding CsgD family transcriptional regulator
MFKALLINLIQYVFVSAMLIGIMVISACGSNDDDSLTQIDTRIQYADSMANFDTQKADSLYRNIIASSKPNSSEKGKALLGLVKLYNVTGNPDTSLLLFKQVLDIYHRNEDTVLLLSYLRARGNHFLTFDHYDSAEVNFTKGYQIARQIGDIKNIQAFNISLGQTLINRSQYSKATKILLEGLKVAEHSKNLPHQAVILHQLAIIAGNTNDFKEAIILQNHSIAIKKKLNLWHDYAEGFQNKGIFYRNLDELDSALNCYQKASKVLATLGDSMGLLMVDYNISVVLKNQKKYDQAEKMLFEVLKTSKRLKIITGEMYALTTLSGVYEENGRLGAALSAIDTALFIAKAKGIINTIPKLLMRRHNILSNMNRFEEAYLTAIEVSLLNDSLLSSEKQKEIQTLKSQYQNERQEADNKLLRKDLNISKQRLKVQWFLILSILLTFILIASLLFNKMRSAIKLKNIELVKSELLRVVSQTQTMSLENAQMQNMLKREELARLELENQLKVETIDRLELQSQLKEQELVYQSLIRNELVNLLKAMQNRLLPFNLKLKRKKDQDEFVTILHELSREVERDPLAEFEIVFQQLHPLFFSNLMLINPSFSKAEIHVAAMIRLNLSTKDIARLMNHSASTIETTRHHIRQKLKLESSDNLTSVLMRI